MGKKAIQLVNMTQKPFPTVWKVLVQNGGNPDATAMHLLEPPKPEASVAEPESKSNANLKSSSQVDFAKDESKENVGKGDSIPSFHIGHYQCIKHQICQIEGVGKMADARGRCQQRLSPHHPRGACGCLICGEDDHRWTCCGKSYLSAGCG